MDQSLKPDPKLKGSYYRRIEDIDRALKKLSVQKLPNKGVQFLAYFFGCEKLALGIVGIGKRWSAEHAYDAKLNLAEIKSAVRLLELSISADDLTYLFANASEQRLLKSINSQCRVSARQLRNKVAHDFGPTNVGNVLDHADFLIPKMKAFLARTDKVLAHLRTLSAARG